MDCVPCQGLPTKGDSCVLFTCEKGYVATPDASQPAFQRCFTVETTSGTMVESTVNYLSILQNGSTLIL